MYCHGLVDPSWNRASSKFECTDWRMSGWELPGDRVSARDEKLSSSVSDRWSSRVSIRII